MSGRGPQTLQWKMQYFLVSRIGKRWVNCTSGNGEVWVDWETIQTWSVSNDVKPSRYRYVSKTGVRFPFMGRHD